MKKAHLRRYAWPTRPSVRLRSSILSNCQSLMPMIRFSLVRSDGYFRCARCAMVITKPAAAIAATATYIQKNPNP